MTLEIVGFSVKIVNMAINCQYGHKLRDSRILLEYSLLAKKYQILSKTDC